jgi:hypothetical protein
MTSHCGAASAASSGFDPETTLIFAEADGNRTRQTEILGLVGVEDRAAHQDRYASGRDPSGLPPPDMACG